MLGAKINDHSIDETTSSDLRLLISSNDGEVVKIFSFISPSLNSFSSFIVSVCVFLFLPAAPWDSSEIVYFYDCWWNIYKHTIDKSEC